MPRNANKTEYSGSFPAGFEAFVLIEDPRNGGILLFTFVGGNFLFFRFGMKIALK